MERFKVIADTIKLHLFAPWIVCGVILRLLMFLCSSFVDIFDVDHFIDVLKDDISIVKELPGEYSWSTREYYGLAIRETRIKAAPVHASAHWYLENVLPVLQRLVYFYFNC